MTTKQLSKLLDEAKLTAIQIRMVQIILRTNGMKDALELLNKFAKYNARAAA